MGAIGVFCVVQSLQRRRGWTRALRPKHLAPRVCIRKVQSHLRLRRCVGEPARAANTKPESTPARCKVISEAK